MTAHNNVQAISVIVPANPFAPPDLTKVNELKMAIAEKLLELDEA